MREILPLFWTLICCVIFIIGCDFDPIPEDVPNIEKPEEETEVEKIAYSGVHFLEVEEYNIPTSIDTIIGKTAIQLMDEKKESDWYIPYYIQKRQEYSDNLSSVLHLSDNVDAVWPGNLIQGASFMNGNLASIPLYSFRKPGKITLALMSGADISYSREVDMNGYSSMNNAINDILSDYQKVGGGFTGKTDYLNQRVHSKEEMLAFFNSDDSQLEEKMSNVQWEKNMVRIAVKLKQVFFTIVYDTPERFKGVFNDEIQVADLAPYVSATNPICYIGSVDYGRVYMLLYEFEESTYTPSSISDLIHVLGDTTKTSVTEYEKEIFNSRHNNVRMFQYGGDQVAGLNAALDATKLHDFIVSGAKFSKENPGVPIEYRALYLDNNSYISRPKQYSVTYTEKIYVPEIQNNTVDFKLNKIVVQPVYALDKANTPRARYSIPEFKIEVIDENNQVESIHRLPGVRNITFNRGAPASITNLYGKFNIPALGENTKKKLRFSFDVTTVIAVAVKHMFGYGSTSDRSSTFKYTIDFKFNANTQKWEPDRMRGLDRRMFETPFRNVYINGNVDHGKVDWNLSYSFEANRIAY